MLDAKLRQEEVFPRRVQRERAAQAAERLQKWADSYEEGAELLCRLIAHSNA